MSNVVRTSWETNRNDAIEPFVAAWNKYGHAGNDEPEDVNTALDAVTVAHVAAVFEWNSGHPTRSKDTEAKAMERLVTAWEKYDETNDDPEAVEELNNALDVLAVAHIAETFEWASGPLKW